jgi:hypothetical protein
MKRVLRIVFLPLGLVLLIVGGAAGFIYFRGIPTYTPQKIDLKVVSTSQRVERGLKLATMLCNSCHLNSQTFALSGKQMLDVPPEFGKIFSANITQHPELGIGKWTDGEIAYLLRTGIRPNGQYIPPYMPKLVHASDEDIQSIIAFLRSNSPLVKAQAIAKTPSEPSFLTKFLSTVNPLFGPAKYPEKPIPTPDTANVLVYGEYLVNLYDCYACHSASFQTNNLVKPRESKGYMGGGNAIYNLEGKPVLSSNLTPDAETGLGKWTESQFITALKTGKRPDGTLFKYPMLPFTRLEDWEAQAIYAYLKTVPPIKNLVARAKK